MTTFTWTAGADGFWNVPGNWNPMQQPGAGDTVEITTAFTVTASDVNDAAAEVDITNAGAEFVVDGTLTVQTIDNMGTLLVSGGGEITGGTTIKAEAGSSFDAHSGTLDGVTWQGTLSLDDLTQASSLDVTSGLNVLNLAGDGPGEIDIAGPGATMEFDGTTTLNGTGGNLLINIGASGAQNEFLSVGASGILTLGSAVIVQQTVAGSDVWLSFANKGTLINDGTIAMNAAGSGAAAQINGDVFINNGTVETDGSGGPTFNGESLDITTFTSFEDSATGVINVKDFGRLGISGPNGAIDISGVVSVSNNSTLDLNGFATVTGNGAIQLSATSTADVITNYQGSVVFLDATDTLALDQPGSFSTGQVVGLSRITSLIHDDIDLLNVSTSTVTNLVPVFTDPSGGVLNVMDNTTTIASLNLVGNYVGAIFSFGTDIAGTGTDVWLGCFTAGTRILTERGEVAVDALQVGDLVPTVLSSEMRPVRWIGRRSLRPADHPDPNALWPIRIAAGAFEDGQPGRDLWLSPDHAVFVGDVLIPVRYLVNGRTIVQEQWDTVTYFHIELDEHDVVLAEGLPAESYLDTNDRANFENGHAPMRLHPDFLANRWEMSGCAPLVVTGPLLAAAQARLLDRPPATQAAYA